MRKKIRLGIITLFLGMLFLGGFTIHTIIKVQSFGELINYGGIVRGASQRLIKLELAGEKHDELIEYLNDILLDLTTGKGSYDLAQLPDEAYNEHLDKQIILWHGIKEDINQVRTDPSAKETLLKDSEAYFVVANQTVFLAQDYATKQTSQLTIMILLLFCGMIIAWIYWLRDDAKKILHLENRNRDLFDKVDRDPLTNAYSLEGFKRIAQSYLDKYPENTYTIIYVDFEDFKYINDVFGYSYGDEILKKYANIIEKDLHDQELCGRVSADNFVILRKYSNKDELLERQKALDYHITEFMRSSHAKHALPINCGFCCIEDTIEALKIEGLLDRANFARKKVKQGVHKNYAFYDESIRQNLWEEKSIRSNLETAFNNKEFCVYYQPKVHLDDEKIICAEALVRWIKPDGTIIGPDKFIPILEKDRNITELDQFVFQEVCRHLASRIQEHKPVLPISVNVSRLQFYNPHFVNSYVTIRDQYQIPHHLLEIEFTESIAFDNIALLSEIVHKLKKAGFTISIDDFGKGYSSLGILESLPVDVLKFDSQFFENTNESLKNRYIVAGIIQIMKKLNITTVAEGIETAEQIQFLKNSHCDIVQGYYYYRPMPTQAYDDILDQVMITG